MKITEENRKEIEICIETNENVNTTHTNSCEKKRSTGTTQRDGMGREEGGGFRMGNTCIPVADSF